jgi:NAD(P)-dependent dehydrogenase (short-subunit alcohol dehydrogenase family)
MAEDLRGKVCLITGASSGIGKETALGIAQLGATTILVCRDERRGRAAQREIVRGSGNGAVHLLIADLSAQEEVRRVAREFSERYERLDILINNAGVVTRERTLTADGLEHQFAVNHLAPFLLTNLLLERLRESAPARIVNVASRVERDGEIDFDDLQGERRYDPRGAYRQSKLANVLFTYELARRLEGTGVTANCLHPGAIATRLLNDLMGRPRILSFLTRRSAPGPAAGARTSIYLASSPECEGVTGRYYSPESTVGSGPYLVEPREIRSSPQSYDEKLAGRLWQVSARLAGLHGEISDHPFQTRSPRPAGNAPSSAATSVVHRPQ